MSSERQRLRPWLEERVNSGDVPGLHWIDKENTKFRVTWKHAGKPDFDLDRDAVLFRMWAEHTGKYKPGEQPDPSTWKTRFRCALHKMPDIEEIRVPHSLDEKEPYRVFKLKPKAPSSPKARRTSVSVNTPSPSPPSDYNMGFSYTPGSFPAHNGFYRQQSYGPMAYSPDGFPFPSPISSHTSSPTNPVDINNNPNMFPDDDDIDSITPTLPPLFTTNGHSDNPMDHSGMKAQCQPIPCTLSDDYLMKNPFTNMHKAYYPVSGDHQFEPTFTELQSVRSESIGYGGGGVGVGLSDGMLFNTVVHNMSNSTQSVMFAQQNGVGANGQMGLLKMLHHSGLPVEMVQDMHIPSVSCGFIGNNLMDNNLNSNSTAALTELQPTMNQTAPHALTLLELEKFAAPKIKKERTAYTLSVRILYDGKEVSAFDLNKEERMWRFCYGKPAKLEDNTGLDVTYGAKPIEMPCLTCSANTQHVLAHFNRGLVLEMTSEGDIWATRSCMSKVFFSCGTHQANNLPRGVRTKVFDFSHTFKQSLREKPTENCTDCDITFSVGQQPDEAPVCIAITHAQAKKLLMEKQNSDHQSRRIFEPAVDSDR